MSAAVAVTKVPPPPPSPSSARREVAIARCGQDAKRKTHHRATPPDDALVSARQRFSAPIRRRIHRSCGSDCRRAARFRRRIVAGGADVCRRASGFVAKWQPPLTSVRAPLAKSAPSQNGLLPGTPFTSLSARRPWMRCFASAWAGDIEVIRFCRAGAPSRLPSGTATVSSLVARERPSRTRLSRHHIAQR
jgi:hypothetical protein